MIPAPLLLTPDMHDAYVIFTDRMVRAEAGIARRRAERPKRSAAAKLGHSRRKAQAMFSGEMG